jgi:hypothetical protein
LSVRHVLAVAVLSLCLAIACSDAAPSAALQPEYSLRSVSSCLARQRAVVSRVFYKDKYLRALHDLAQQTSRQAVLRERLVGFAVVPTVANAQLLAELLLVPGSPYRIVQRRNVVLMYKPSAAQAFRAVIACLRG